MTARTRNIIALAAVAAIVSFAYWNRSRRSQDPEGAPPAAAESTEAADPTEAVLDELIEIPDSAAALDEAPIPAATPGRPRLVDLGATECTACKMLAPILDELREEYRDRLDVVFIDVWKNPSAKDPYNIRLIPTQILFDGSGAEVWRHEGFIFKDDLKAAFAEKVGVQ
ncbi:MAG: thioredoxin family protein [Planctomycetes bacterium]|nr:thioredoxin family protein [Planctomycetota bacterium]